MSKRSLLIAALFFSVASSSLAYTLLTVYVNNESGFFLPLSSSGYTNSHWVENSNPPTQLSPGNNLIGYLTTSTVGNEVTFGLDLSYTFTNQPNDTVTCNFNLNCSNPIGNNCSVVNASATYTNSSTDYQAICSAANIIQPSTSNFYVGAVYFDMDVVNTTGKQSKTK